MARETRSQKSAKFPKIYELLGSESEIPHSELPTLRQCLRYGLLLRERLVEDLDIRVMCKSICLEVKTIWNKVNPEICIIGGKTALDKLVKEWENAKSCAKNKGISKAFSDQFNERLDKLFDLAKCKCTIYECIEQSYSGCEYKDYVVCDFPRNEKISLM